MSPPLRHKRLAGRARRPTALVTLGRLPVALELVRAMHACGYRTIVAEPLALHLCRLSRAQAAHRAVRSPVDDAQGYLDDLVDIVRRDAIDVVVPVSEEALHVAALHQRLAEPVVCPPEVTLLRLHDKLDSLALFASLGRQVPETEALDDSASLWRRHDWVVKPRHGSSGRGVTLGRRGEPPPAASDAVLQRRLTGDALCSFSFVRDGEVGVSLAYRSLLEAGSVSVRFEAVALPREVHALIDAVARATGYTGMLAFDLLQDGDGRWLPIECNPRATSGVHLLTPEECMACVAWLLDTSKPSPAIDADAIVGRRRQEYRSCLLVQQAALLRGRFDRRAWHDLFSVRDICWRRDDPLPALGMTPASLPLLWRALRAREPITRVAMADLAWPGAR